MTMAETGLMHVMTVPQTFVLLTGQATFMREHGFALTAVASDGPYATVFAAQEGVDVVAVEMPRRITPLADLHALRALVRVIRARRPAIVHAHTPKGGLLGMLAATIARVPIRIYHLRGLPLETATGVTRLLLTLSERVSCSLAHRVLCNSDSLRRQVLSLHLVSGAKIVVPCAGSGNGVDAAAKYNPDRESSASRGAQRDLWSIPHDAVVVAFVGRLARDKGVAELAAAWSQVRDEFPAAVLMLAGPVDEAREALPTGVLQALQSDPRVRLTGLLRDARQVYVAADLVVHPSHREGFPNVPLEAAAMGLPVITTTATGCIDSVVDATTGAIVPTGDADALAVALQRYLASPTLRAAHGAAGQERARRDFLPQRLWEAYLSEYRALLTARGLPVPTAQRRLDPQFQML